MENNFYLCTRKVPVMSTIASRCTIKRRIWSSRVISATFLLPLPQESPSCPRQPYENPHRQRPLQYPRQIKRHPHQHPRQRCRKRHKMAQCDRMVLLHQQRPNNLGPYLRMLLRSCKKELPRQTHQNRLLRLRSRLGRKLLHPPPLPLPRSPNRKLLHGQSTRPGLHPEQIRQTSHHRHPRRSHHRIPLFPLSVIPTITVIRHPRPRPGIY